MRIGYWLLEIGVVLAACGQATQTPLPTPPEPVRMAVTELAAPLAADLVAAYRERGDVPSVTVIPLSSLADELQSGRADFALTANPDAAPFATPVAHVSFAIVVHPNNPVTRLSLAQVRGILAGEIVDWAQVGGGTGTIQLVLREPNSDGARAFDSAVGIEVVPPPSALLAPTWAAMRELVAESSGAFGYLPQPELSDEVRTVSLDTELRVLLVAVASAEPSGRARDFLAWVQSDEGQRAVAQRYERVR